MEYKSRNDVPEKYKWDLRKIFQSDKDFENAFRTINEYVDEVVSYKGKIMESGETLYNFYLAYEKMGRLLGRLYMYSCLNCDSDTTDNKYKRYRSKVTKLNNDISSKTSFISSEILSTDYNIVKKYIEEDSRLKELSFELEKFYRYKNHTLSEKEEAIITEANNAFGTGSDTFYFIDNTDINLGNITDECGNEVELTNSNYNKYMNSKNRNVRKDAFDHMYRYFESLKNSIAACLKGNIKEDFFESKVRNFNSPLEKSLYADNIDKKVYINLIDTVHNHLDLVYRYMNLRKKALNLDENHMYDIYVDLVDNNHSEIQFENGKEIIFQALKPLGDQYLNDLQKAFNEHWIDVYPNKGKKSGAYSWGSYDTNPYLLLNYNENIDSVSTMAHELGHSMHSYYSNLKQNYYNSGYPIFLAEIASTVNEILLNDYMYKNAKTREEKIIYLTDFLDKVRTTIYRQTMFAEYEMIMHDKYEQGIPLVEEEFSQTYYDLNKLYYGDSVVSDKLIRYEWARIPHFYTSFYVYKYATGLSAALSIASDILSGNIDVRDKYLEFLASGGSDYPLNILKKVGVDMTNKEPIEKALEMFNKKLKELESLL